MENLLRNQKRINRDLELENARLRMNLEKANAALEYVAMMTDVDLMNDSEDGSNE